MTGPEWRHVPATGIWPTPRRAELAREIRAGQPVDPNWTLAQFRWRNDDGNESSAGATFAALANTNLTNVSIDAGNVEYRLRININQTLTNSTSNANDPDIVPRLEYKLNSGGTWTTMPASGAGTVVEMDGTDSGLTDGSACTNHGFTLAYTFDNDGTQEETSADVATALTHNAGSQNSYICEWAIILLSAGLSNGDTLYFRVTDAGTLLDSYSYGDASDTNPITISVTETTATDGQVSETATVRVALPGEIAEAASVNVELPVILDEKFENVSGYDESWTENTQGTSTLDPDYPTSSLTSPPADWGDDCLEVSKNATEDAFIRHEFGPDYPVSYSRIEFIVPTGGGPASGTSTEIFRLFDASFNNLFSLAIYTGDGTNYTYVVNARYDGANHFWYPSFTFDQYENWEFYWNSTDDEWEIRRNGATYQSGSLSSTAAAWELGAVDVCAYAAADAITLYADNIGVRTDTWWEAGTTAGEVSESASVNIKVPSEVQETGSANVALPGEISEAASVNIGAQIWDEQFEADPGYDETWSHGETNTNGTLDEDYPTSSVTGAPASWGADCLQCVNVPTEDSLVEHRFAADYPVTTVAFSVIVEAESLANSQFNFICATEDSAGNPLGRFAVGQDSGGNLVIFARVYATGSAVDYDYSVSPISLDNEYRFEFYWNTLADEWEWRVNGSTEASGALSGAAVDWEMDRLLIGIPANADAASTIYYDNVKVNTGQRWESFGTASQVSETASVNIKVPSEVQETGSANVALPGEVFETGSAHVALPGETADTASANVALQSQASETGSALIGLISQFAKAASIAVALTGQAAEPASANVGLYGETASDASANICLVSETASDASTNIALVGETASAASVNIQFVGETAESASVTVKVPGETQSTASVNVTGTNLGQVAETASANIAAKGAVFDDASANVALRSEAASAASVDVALRSETSSAASVTVALRGEVSYDASINVTLGATGQIAETASINIALPSQVASSASINVELLTESQVASTASINVRAGGIQESNPNADIAVVGTWKDELGGTTNIYQSIDETRLDTDDYIWVDR